MNSLIIAELKLCFNTWCLCSRWAGEQAKKRELGDVIDFVRDLQL